MDFRVFDFFLDPVLVVSANSKLRYVNPAGLKWLFDGSLQTLLEKSLDEIVSFESLNLQQMSGQLGALQGIPASHRAFEMHTRRYQGFAKVSMQRLPTDDGSFALAIIVRDRVFAEVVYDEGLHDTNTNVNIGGIENTAVTAVTPAPAPVQTQEAQEEMVNINTASTQNDVLGIDEIALFQNLSTLDMLPYETKIIINSPQAGRPLVSKTLRIAADSVDVAAEPGVLKQDTKCSMEVFGTSSLGPFPAMGTVTGVWDKGIFEEVRIKFDQISPSIKKNILELLKARQS